MISYNPDYPVISIHIPKCGGTSLKVFLEENFKEKLFLHYFDEKKNMMPEKYELKSGGCIHGHFNRKRKFGVMDFYPDAKQFITILRDPFELLLSRFFHVKREESNGLAYRDGQHITLNNNVNEYIKSQINNNNYHPNILDYFPFEISLNNYITLINENFIYIGIMEDYDFSVGRLSEKLGFSFVGGVPHLNESPRYLEVDKSLKESFTKSHALEYKVYNYVRDHYKKW